MQAGLTDSLWTFGDLFDNVMESERERLSDERYAKLAARMRGK